MLELYALESRLRDEIDRLMSDHARTYCSTLRMEDAFSMNQRYTILRILIGEERTFTITDGPEMSSFAELWEAA